MKVITIAALIAAFALTGCGNKEVSFTDAVLEAPIHVEAIQQSVTGMAEAA